jgi:hypothetical protein
LPEWSLIPLQARNAPAPRERKKEALARIIPSIEVYPLNNVYFFLWLAPVLMLEK